MKKFIKYIVRAISILMLAYIVVFVIKALLASSLEELVSYVTTLIIGLIALVIAMVFVWAWDS